jgi:homocysteine S-methyltransferase
VPIFVGVMPLVSYRNALFLHNEVPGIQLPETVLERMSRFEGEDARREGMAIAMELLDEAMKWFNGIYLMTPFLRYEMTAELTRYVWRKAAQTNLWQAGADGRPSLGQA